MLAQAVVEMDTSMTLASQNPLTTKFLEGKIALVTGASRGIGKATAQILAGYGATVALVSRKLEQVEQVRQEFVQRGGKAIALSCDVSRPEEVEKTIEALVAQQGGLHILVNNAGIARDTLLVRMKNEDWEEVLRTNLTGTFYFSRAAAKIMMKQHEGRIVNIASVIGLTGNAGQANYAASKAGVIGFTKSMAKELGSRGITVNAIAPGFIETEMTEKLGEKVKIDLLRRIPLGSLGSPEDVAWAALFLVSPLAKYITGQVLNVDGGMVM